MRTIKKFLNILNKQQKMKCILITIAITIGSVLEAIGVAAVLPVITLISDTDWLETHEDVAAYLRMIGITGHKQLIILCALGLIVALVMFAIFKKFRRTIANQAKISTSYYADMKYLFYQPKNYAAEHSDFVGDDATVEYVSKEFGKKFLLNLSKLHINKFQK